VGTPDSAHVASLKRWLPNSCVFSVTTITCLSLSPSMFSGNAKRTCLCACCKRCRRRKVLHCSAVHVVWEGVDSDIISLTDDPKKADVVSAGAAANAAGVETKRDGDVTKMDGEERKTLREASVNNAADGMEVAVRMVSCVDRIYEAALRAKPTRHDQDGCKWFQHFPSQALLYCGGLYCKSLEHRVQADKEKAQMSNRSKHFFHLIKCLIRLCRNVNECDATGSNILHYLLRTIPAIKRAGSPMLADVRFGAIVSAQSCSRTVYHRHGLRLTLCTTAVRCFGTFSASLLRVGVTARAKIGLLLHAR